MVVGVDSVWVVAGLLGGAGGVMKCERYVRAGSGVYGGGFSLTPG